MKFKGRAANPRGIAVILVMLVLTRGVRSAAQVPELPQTAASSQTVLLKEGTEVKLKLGHKLTSNTAIEGDPVNLILDQDLRVGQVTVAKAGSVAVGTISRANRSGILGRPGDLGLNLNYLKAEDSKVRLRGMKGKQGKGREGAAVAFTVLFGPIGLIKRGRNAEFEQGTPLVAYVDQDTALPAIR